MYVDIVFFSARNKVYSFKVLVSEFESVLSDILPIHLNVPFTENSELCDTYYIRQFWSRLAITKSINEVLFMSEFLDKMIVYGYDFSQFSKLPKRNSVKTFSLKRKNGDVSTITGSRCCVFPGYTGTRNASKLDCE